MNNRLQDKKILVGITGGIAAYKSADLVRRLRKAGADVRVAMTMAAKAFITPLTLQAVSGYRVSDDLFSEEAEAGMGHIELARWADLILIAPGTADFIARLAHGFGNDVLTTLCLVTTAPIAVVPAMNHQMWKHNLTQENIEKLKRQQIKIWGPAEGEQACGDMGLGRMLEPEDLVVLVATVFQRGKLSGKKIMITAGPTQEPIDPVRYVTNRSSGKMGFALASAAQKAGADVTLISGPVALSPPAGVSFIAVNSAQEMYNAVMERIKYCDIFIGAAAVADYRVEPVLSQKMKKDSETITLHLQRNPDIIKAVANLKNKPFVVGFAAETDRVMEYAKLKLQEKNLDIVIANQVGPGQGFDSDHNAVTIIYRDGQVKAIPLAEKNSVAREIIYSFPIPDDNKPLKPKR